VGVEIEESLRAHNEELLGEVEFAQERIAGLKDENELLKLDADRYLGGRLEMEMEAKRHWRKRAESAEAKLKEAKAWWGEWKSIAKTFEAERDDYKRRWKELHNVAGENVGLREAIQKACTDTGCLNSYTEASCDPAEPGCPMCILEAALKGVMGVYKFDSKSEEAAWLGMLIEKNRRIAALKDDVDSANLNASEASLATMAVVERAKSAEAERDRLREALKDAPKIPVNWIGSAEYWVVYVNWFEGHRKAALADQEPKESTP